jgi:hypothetical protein
MGQTNGIRGAHRGVRQAEQLAADAQPAANAEFRATGQSGPAERKFLKAAQNATNLRRARRTRGEGQKLH